MNAFSGLTKSHMLFPLVALAITIGWPDHLLAQQQSTSAQDEIEVLTRGPVHEAFAETITFDPEPGIVVAQAPPDPVEEIAPDQRPQGDNVTWIPGYWGWDDERNDFLWISGIWRALPPGRQWVPGYWGPSQQGHQWTSGYWADATAKQIDYLPEPPASVEAGPNVAAPSADATWLPGSWIWQQNRYGWRAGYWAEGNQDWDWVPDHYVWTPRGYVFVDGYYDYSVSRRGVVFAPVYLNQGLRSRRGFSYSPSTVINPGVFVSHLFLRPGYGHYYFGDYYGSDYANAGFAPWFSYQSSRRGYDPIYANQRWQHRHDRSWEQQAEANFRNFRDNESARPPRNWAAQRELTGQRERSDRRNVAVAAPLDDLAGRKDGQLRFQPVNPTERQQFGQRGQEYRKYLQQRQQSEANARRAPVVDPNNPAVAARRNFSQSPFVSQPVDRLGKDYTPPQRHHVLKPDFQIQPQPRTRGGTPGTRQGLNSGTPGGPSGQSRFGPQGQQQRQDTSQGRRQGAFREQSQSQGANPSNNRREMSNGQQQSGPRNRSQNRTNGQQGASQGQQQGGAGGQAGGQAQGSPPSQDNTPSQ